MVVNTLRLTAYGCGSNVGRRGQDQNTNKRNQNACHSSEGSFDFVAMLGLVGGFDERSQCLQEN